MSKTRSVSLALVPWALTLCGERRVVGTTQNQAQVGWSALTSWLAPRISRLTAKRNWAS